MALPKTGITTSLVGNTLGTSARNVGALCSSSLINPWSRWKPIRDACVTLDYSRLQYRNFGIEIIKANNPSGLVDNIKANGNVGFNYVKPIGGSVSPYRLGDFRNYEHNAVIPLMPSYKDGATQNIGGATSGNPAYEKPLDGFTQNGNSSGDNSGLPYLTTEDIYVEYDRSGQRRKLHRGVLVTDGVNTVWHSKVLCWWDTRMQKFVNKTVTAYEFLTDAISTPSSPYGGGDHVFMALPDPVYTIKVTSNSAAGSKKVRAIITATKRASDERYIDYTLQFSAVGDEYRGGTINAIRLKLTSDSAGLNPIQTANGIPASLTISKGQTSAEYRGTFFNNTNKLLVYVCLFYDYELQYSRLPLMQNI